MDLFYLSASREDLAKTLIEVDPPFQHFPGLESHMTRDQSKCARNMLHILYNQFPAFYRRFSLLEAIEFNTQLGS